MKTAIIYYSKYGTTEQVAHLLGEKLDNGVDYISLRESPKPLCVTVRRECHEYVAHPLHGLHVSGYYHLFVPHT